MPTITFYVDATNGNDTQWAWHERLNDSSRPYQTVGAVVDALYVMEAEMTNPAKGLDRPVTVVFHEGTYELDETVVIDTELSGDPSAGIWLTFKAFRWNEQDPTSAEEVLFSGGERITTWGQGGGCQGDTSTQGATKSKWWGTWVVDYPISDLWVNNDRATLAREPDIGEGINGSGFARILTSYVEETATNYGDRKYIIDHPLRNPVGTEPCGGIGGHVEAVAISEWTVSRSLVNFDPLQAPVSSLGSGQASLWFERETPLGKVCGIGVETNKTDLCTSLPQDFYPGWSTVRGIDHIQCCPDYLAGVSKPVSGPPHAPRTDCSGFPVSYGAGMGARDDRLFVEGSKGFMDERFEWYQRRIGCHTTEQINIRLPATTDCVAEMDPRTDTTVIVPRLTKLFRIEGEKAMPGGAHDVVPVRGVHVRDIMFAFTNWTRPGVHTAGDYEMVTFSSRGIQQFGLCQSGNEVGDGRNFPPSAMEISFGEGVIIEGCRFAHTAAGALTATAPFIEYEYGGFHDRDFYLTESEIELDGVVLRGNEFFDIGGNAINIRKFGDNWFASDKLSDGFTYFHTGPYWISNNLIHNRGALTDFSVGVRTHSSAGIWVDVAQHTYIKNNEIQDTPDAGIFGAAVNHGMYSVTQLICGQYETVPDLMGKKHPCGQTYDTRMNPGDSYSYRGLQGDFFVQNNYLSHNLGLITDGASIYLRSSPGSTRVSIADPMHTLWDPQDTGLRDPRVIATGEQPRDDAPEAWVSDNYVESVAQTYQGVTGGQNTAAGLYFDNCSANWNIVDNRFKDAGDWLYVQVAVEDQSAFPASFSWGPNYFDIDYPLLWDEPSLASMPKCTVPDAPHPNPLYWCMLPEMDARLHIESRLCTRVDCDDYESVLPVSTILSTFTGCSGVCLPGTCVEKFKPAQIKQNAGPEAYWDYLRTDTSAKIHP